MEISIIQYKQTKKKNQMDATFISMKLSTQYNVCVHRNMVADIGTTHK